MRVNETGTGSSRKGQRRHEMALSHQRTIAVRICQKLLSRSVHSFTRCLSFCLVLIATLLYQTAIKEGYMSNTEERRKLSNGFVFLERLLHIHIIVFHLIYVQGKGFCGLKLQHIISCSLSQFLILDLTHQRFR